MQELITAIGRIPTATLHEAMGRRGAMLSYIKPIRSGMKLVGRALPVRCPAADNLGLHAAIAMAKPGDVLVASMDGNTEGGAWGEIATVAAQVRGIRGLVIDGAVRDTERICALQFPVFAKGVSIKGTTKKTLLSVGQPVVCGGVLVNPGDIVVGDDDGVVVVPLGEAEKVLKAATEKERTEAEILEQIRQGKLTVDLLGLRPLLEGEKR
ncbi:MAG TPA: 4-carboxy-4-hydroxy-2-oxoadipate aldolase/oxaloacetate decarboxylase [Firmicutes bacterium]|nr:4-carboxy-4-hydroxy-2-oxoadipate aldolase/oxaloacetate decarboxylase [Bacillota bacterium]